MKFFLLILLFIKISTYIFFSSVRHFFFLVVATELFCLPNKQFINQNNVIVEKLSVMRQRVIYNYFLVNFCEIYCFLFFFFFFETRIKDNNFCVPKHFEREQKENIHIDDCLRMEKYYQDKKIFLQGISCLQTRNHEV